jgi:prephenate dehydrogenase
VKVAIVGAGLLGTSVALAARRADPAVDIVALDRGDSIDRAAGAEVIVLAAPVDAILDLVGSPPAALRHAVLTDVGSTKRAIVHAAAAAGLSQFVGGHPMAGAATSGPSGARADLFDGQPWFLVPHQAPADAVARVRGFVERLGARAVEFADDGAEHDRLMASVSHLPQVAAAALMKVVGDAAGEAGLRWAGAGCRDTTRLAGSAASVWEGILRTNADALRPLIRALADELHGVADTLDDPASIRRLFEAANEYRRLLERSQ